MLYYRLTAAVLCGALVLSLSACSDPTSVGAGVGPDSLRGGDPVTEEIVPSTLEASTVPSRTGYNVPATVPSNQRRTWRFLSGSVYDPLAGTITADGYVDFIGPASREPIQDAEVDSLDANLRLVPTYLHGDTTSTLSLQLFDLSEDATMSRAPSDTSFSAEAQAIDSYSISPTDSVVTLSLPRSWIEEHQEELQDTTAFNNSFHGFKISAAGEANNAVAGFDHGSSTLEVATSSDTVAFPVQKSFSHVERRNAPPTDSNRVVLVDGVGTGLKMAWDDNPLLDSLRASNTPLNRADITVPVDTTSSTDANFARPLPTNYRILASRTPDGPSCSRLGLLVRPDESDTCILFTNNGWAPQAARAASQTAFQIFEYSFFNPPPLSSFYVEIADRESTDLSTQETARRGIPSTIPVVVHTADVPTDELPRATLIVTPL